MAFRARKYRSRRLHGNRHWGWFVRNGPAPCTTVRNSILSNNRPGSLSFHAFDFALGIYSLFSTSLWSYGNGRSEIRGARRLGVHSSRPQYILRGYIVAPLCRRFVAAIIGHVAILPPALNEDPFRIIPTARAITAEELQDGIALAESWGLRVQLGSGVGRKAFPTSGFGTRNVPPTYRTR